MRALVKAFIVLFSIIVLAGFISDKECKDKIEVVFNRTLKFNNVVEIRNDLSEKGITLDYQKLEFDEDGGLLTVYFKIDFNDGFSGAAGKSNLTKQSKFGFYRNYADDSEEPFGTGDIE